MWSNSRGYKIGDIVEMKYSWYTNKKAYGKIVWIYEDKYAIVWYDVERKKEWIDSNWYIKWEFYSIEE